MRKFACVLWLALLAVLFNAPTRAQSNPGEFSFTYGVTANEQPRDEGAGARRVRGPLNFKVRFTERLTGGVSNDTFSSKKQGDGTYITGVGNTTLSLKTDVFKEGNGRPDFNFTYTITLPTAKKSKGLGSGRVDHKLTSTVARTFRGTQLGVDFGVLFAGRKDASGFTTTGLLNLTLDRALNPAFKFHSEVDLVSRAEKNPSEIFLINHVTYKANPRVSLRVGARTGITVNSSRVGLIASLIVNGKLWKPATEK